MRWLAENIAEARCSGIKVVIMLDQEQAIMSRKKAVPARCTSSLRPEIRVQMGTQREPSELGLHESEHYDTTSSGRIGAKLSKDSALMSCLAAWAGDEIFRYSIPNEGRNSFEGVTGHTSNLPLAVLGERVDFMYTLDKNKRHKVDGDWDREYFMGVNPEHLNTWSSGQTVCTRAESSGDW